jgi:hypothetical protein
MKKLLAWAIGIWVAFKVGFWIIGFVFSVAR